MRGVCGQTPGVIAEQHRRRRRAVLAVSWERASIWKRSRGVPALALPRCIATSPAERPFSRSRLPAAQCVEDLSAAATPVDRDHGAGRRCMNGCAVRWSTRPSKRRMTSALAIDNGWAFSCRNCTPIRAGSTLMPLPYLFNARPRVGIFVKVLIRSIC